MTGKSVVMDELRAVAEGKVACACGNDDWHEFLYVSAGGGGYVAGCKRCGRTYTLHNGGAWEFMRGPAPAA
jgi:hypothetical protein